MAVKKDVIFSSLYSKLLICNSGSRQLALMKLMEFLVGHLQTGNKKMLFFREHKQANNNYIDE